MPSALRCEEPENLRMEMMEMMGRLRECWCANEQFFQLSAFFFFCSLKTKGELKAEKFTHWQPMALSATPAFYCMNKQQLFTHLISPSTLSAN